MRKKSSKKKASRKKASGKKGSKKALISNDKSEARARSNANLVLFKPGQSGNPAGRPKIKSMEEVMRGLLAETVKVPGGDAITRMELLAKVIISEATNKRNAKVIGEIFARVWPKPQTVKVIGDPDHPFPVELSEAVDYRNLSDKELAQMRKLIVKAQREGAGDGGSD